MKSNDEKTLRELLTDALLALSAATERVPPTENAQWNIEEAITHVEEAMAQHKSLIRNEEKGIKNK